jgi:hypothetical protein
MYRPLRADICCTLLHYSDSYQHSVVNFGNEHPDDEHLCLGNHVISFEHSSADLEHGLYIYA